MCVEQPVDNYDTAMLVMNVTTESVERYHSIVIVRRLMKSHQAPDTA